MLRNRRNYIFRDGGLNFDFLNNSWSQNNTNRSNILILFRLLYYNISSNIYQSIRDINISIDIYQSIRYINISIDIYHSIRYINISVDITQILIILKRRCSIKNIAYLRSNTLLRIRN